MDLLFYPDKFVGFSNTDSWGKPQKNPTSYMINPFTANKSKNIWNALDKVGVMVVTVNENNVLYSTNDGVGLFQQDIKMEGARTPIEIPEGGKLSNIMNPILTSDNHALYVIETNGSHAVYMDGKRVTDIPDITSVENTVVVGRVVYLDIVLPNGAKQQIAIDPVLNRARGRSGTE